MDCARARLWHCGGEPGWPKVVPEASVIVRVPGADTDGMGMVLSPATYNRPVRNAAARGCKAAIPSGTTNCREAAIHGEVTLRVRIEIDIPIRIDA